MEDKQLIKELAKVLLNLANEKKLLSMVINTRMEKEKGKDVRIVFITALGDRGYEIPNPHIIGVNSDNDQLYIRKVLYQEYSNYLDDDWKPTNPDDKRYKWLEDKSLSNIYAGYKIFDSSHAAETLTNRIDIKYSNTELLNSMIEQRKVEYANKDFYDELLNEIAYLKKIAMKTIITFELLKEKGCINCGFDIYSNNFGRNGYLYDGELCCQKCGTVYLVGSSTIASAIQDGIRNKKDIRIYNDIYKSNSHEMVIEDFTFEVSQGHTYHL